MRRPFKHALWLLVLTNLAFTASAQPADQAGSASAQFLKIGIGARPISMGGAYTALSSDANSMYWNPAGLTGFNGTQVSLMHNKWFQGINYEFLGLAYADSGVSAFAVGLSFLWMDDIAVTTFSDPVGASGNTFTARDLSFVFSYGHQVTDYVSLGGTIKRIRSEIAEISAGTTAFDLGGKVFTPIRGLTFGATLQNMGPGLKFVNESDRLPLTYKVGGAYTYRNIVTVAVDVGKPIDNKVRVNAGGEFVLLNTMSLRGGYNSANELDRGLTGGIGIKLQKISIDYAFVPYGVLGDTHRFSASYHF